MPDTPPTLARRWLLLFALLYAGLYFWYSWPLGAAFGSAIVGYPARDANVFLWNVWHFRHQVAAGHNPFHTDLLLYPQGTSLWLHTYTPVLGLLGLLVGQAYWALNLGLLLSTVLSGVGAARLAGRWVRQPLLCGLVGLAFAFSPYRLARWPEHTNLMLTATVPFYVSFYLDAFAFAAGRWWPRVRSRRALAGAAGLLVITFLSDYYVLAGLVYFSVGYAAWWGLRLGELNWRRWPAWAGLVAVFVAGHFLARGLGLLNVDDRGGFWWSGDLGGYLVPPPGSRWLASAATDAFWRSPRLPRPLSAANPTAVEEVTFLGYALPLAALALAARALLSRRRAGAAAPAPSPPAPAETRPFWALLVLFVLLTLPEVRWQGHALLRLPTGLVHYVPFFNNIRCPTRHVLLASLLLPLAVSLGLDRWLAGAARRWLGAGLLTLAVFGEYQHQPYPLLRAQSLPAAYRLAAAEPARVLLALPLGLQDGLRYAGAPSVAARDLFYQTQHGKALRGGYLARIEPAAFRALRTEPGLGYLLLAQEHPDSLALVPPPTPAEVAAFRRRYAGAVFVVHPGQREGPAHRCLRAWLGPLGYREQLVPDGPAGIYALLSRPAARP